MSWRARHERWVRLERTLRERMRALIEVGDIAEEARQHERWCRVIDATLDEMAEQR